jgi:hypothetical protein
MSLSDGVRVGFVALSIALGGPATADGRPGIAPDSPWTCPASHPIKGYVSVESGARVYFLPGSPFYDEASPERCYASEDEARHDGSRPQRTPSPRQPSTNMAMIFWSIASTDVKRIRVRRSPAPAVASLTTLP